MEGWLDKAPSLLEWAAWIAPSFLGVGLAGEERAGDGRWACCPRSDGAQLTPTRRVSCRRSHKSRCRCKPFESSFAMAVSLQNPSRHPLGRAAQTEEHVWSMCKPKQSTPAFRTSVEQLKNKTMRVSYPHNTSTCRQVKDVNISSMLGLYE